MSVFGNNTINRTYVQGALRGFAERASGLFSLVYLLKMGISVCSLKNSWDRQGQ